MSLITEFKDWKGDLLKEDDEVIIVRTKPALMSSAYYIFDVGKGEMEKISEAPKESEYAWVIQRNFIVAKSPHKDKLCAKVGNYYIDLSLIFNVDLQANEIVCIEGVSDSEEEYYKHYFETQ